MKTGMELSRDEREEEKRKERKTDRKNIFKHLQLLEE